MLATMSQATNPVGLPGMRRSFGRQILRDAHERAYADPRPAFRRVTVRLARVPCRPGDVQMRPAQPLTDELPQEDARDQHAAEALAHVLEVGHLRVDALAQLLREG